MLKVCCKCHKIKKNGLWVKTKNEPLSSVLGYCPECAHEELAAIRAYYDGKRKMMGEKKPPTSQA